MLDLETVLVILAKHEEIRLLLLNFGSDEKTKTKTDDPCAAIKTSKNKSASTRRNFAVL